MPTDNPDPILPGGDVAFPQNGAIRGTDITRTGDTSFTLVTPGTYQVQFQVPVSEAGQLVLTLNGAQQLYTVAGQSGTNGQLTGVALVQTAEANEVLTLRNPAGNTNSLTVTPSAGGAAPASAHLTILRLV